MADKQKRYVGLDVHKNYVMVGAVNRLQEMVLPPRKVSLTEFEGWACLAEKFNIRLRVILLKLGPDCILSGLWRMEKK